MAGKPHEIETLSEGHAANEVELMPGDVFAVRYRIERRLGRGSMGTVFAAHDDVVDELVALKLLATPSERALERFRREVRLARKVTHRNAARTFDLGEHDGRSFITMELVEGESLRQRLDRRTRLSVDEVVELASQVCLGLQAAHDVGVVHRDLKPGNVLVEAGGRAVITDFGVAFSTVVAPVDGGTTQAGTTHGGTTTRPLERPPMAGTPAYMAPEQVLGLQQDGRTDLFALGVMLYELLTGQTPWTGGNHIEVAMARMLGPTPDPRSLVAVPEPLAELVLACLAREPDHRLKSASEVVERLAALRTRPGTGSGRARPGEGSSSTGSLFVPTAVGEHTLAVMPFRYRGPADDGYLAEALTDELIDLLAMTRGLKVSASGATQRYKDERDARTVGRALGVSSVIDGTVQHADTEVRIVARLVDVDTGFQRWSERFAGPLEDVFELQDRMAKRVAEALRVELSLQEHGTGASREAVEQYLRGRARARDPDVTGAAFELALQHYQRAREASPSFVLPLAAIADATVRRWFVAQHPDGERWAEAARIAVEAALEGAPTVAETHEAAARLEVNRGNFRAAAEHLDAALRIAPTCAAAHEYLGMLQCDGGRSREGVQHISLAHELDPTLGMGGTSILRYHAIRGDWASFDAMLEQMRRNPSVPRFAVNLFEIRMSLWRGDPDRARAVRWPSEIGTPMLVVVDPLRMVLDESVSTEALAAKLDASCAQAASPRLRTTWRQLSVELLTWRGAPGLALRALATADEEGLLIDADWLERCPLLKDLEDEPEFLAIRERVRQRANDIWRVAPGRVR